MAINSGPITQRGGSAGGTLSGNVTITGNLTVNGTTTSVVNQTLTGDLKVTNTSATAAVFEDASNTNFLTVDTSTPQITIGDAPVSVNGTQAILVPDQTDFAGTLVIGDGGGSLTHSTGNQGWNNSFLGIGAGVANTTGSNNSFFGSDTGSANTSGSFNSFFGRDTGSANTSGSFNSFFGSRAGKGNITGANNSFFGQQAGRYIANGSTPNATGSTSVFLGNDTKANADGESNQIVIGYDAIGQGSNSVTLGNTNVTKTVLRGNVGINQTTFDGTGTAALTMGTGTAPASGLTDAFQLYSADASGAGTAAPHFKTEAGNVIKLYQQSTGVSEAAFVENAGGTAVNVDSTFGGYTLQQIAQALQNAGLLA